MLPGELNIGADSHSCTYGATGCYATGIGSTDLAAAMATGRLWMQVPETYKLELIGQRPQSILGKDIILHIIGMLGSAGVLNQAMEYAGDGLLDLPMEERLTMSNMAIEAGAQNGIFPYDEITETFLKGRAKKPFTPVYADADAESGHSPDPYPDAHADADHAPGVNLMRVFQIRGGTIRYRGGPANPLLHATQLVPRFGVPPT